MLHDAVSGRGTGMDMCDPHTRRAFEAALEEVITAHNFVDADGVPLPVGDGLVAAMGDALFYAAVMAFANAAIPPRK